MDGLVAERESTLYEYRGLMAQTWDWLRGDPSGRDDRDFYLAMIEQRGGPVLDLGCGTGRLLLDFLQLGIDIEGVDISPEMLAICREKAAVRGLSPTLYEQALETLTLPRRYATVLAPSSVLQLIPDKELIRAAVRRIHDHLLPGGVFVAPFMTLWQEGMPLQREWEAACVREVDGALLQRMGRMWYDPATECESTEDLYQVVVDGACVAVEHHRRVSASRSYTQSQALALLRAAGFTQIEVMRGFSHVAAAQQDDLYVLIACVPTGA
jgi:ubiquinone/menaquinone biosynthesis C-methylase UbiE